MRKLLFVLTVLLTASGAVGCASPNDLGVAGVPREHRTDDAPPNEFFASDGTGFAVFGDGSGIQYIEHEETRLFPRGTFVVPPID